MGNRKENTDVLGGWLRVSLCCWQLLQEIKRSPLTGPGTILNDSPWLLSNALFLLTKSIWEKSRAPRNIEELINSHGTVATDGRDIAQSRVTPPAHRDCHPWQQYINSSWSLSRNVLAIWWHRGGAQTRQLEWSMMTYDDLWPKTTATLIINYEISFLGPTSGFRGGPLGVCGIHTEAICKIIF